MKPRSFLESFNSAAEGILYVLKTQRNMRIHFLIAIIILVGSLFLRPPLSPVELIILSLTIALVLITEMINTAVEKTIDLMSDTYHPLARIAKDITAGTVLIVSVVAIVVGYLILFRRYLAPGIETAIANVKASSAHITFVSLMVVVLTVILFKALAARSSGFMLSGGMPSLHSALAGAIWIVLSLVSGNPIVIVLAFILALFVAQSRIAKGIHSLKEVAFGALLGILTALLIFQLFRRII
ncbi:MAG TPA: phosphatase PAP2 family protein [bacterium]|nr:phosphatase PAP2 family protein [bacterium]